MLTVNGKQLCEWQRVQLEGLDRPRLRQRALDLADALSEPLPSLTQDALIAWILQAQIEAQVGMRRDAAHAHARAPYMNARIHTQGGGEREFVQGDWASPAASRDPVDQRGRRGWEQENNAWESKASSPAVKAVKAQGGWDESTLGATRAPLLAPWHAQRAQAPVPLHSDKLHEDENHEAGRGSFHCSTIPAPARAEWSAVMPCRTRS